MKSLPIFPSAKSRRAPGFTLVEMLVSIAVLGILVLILAQIFGIMNSAWLYGQGKINNFAKARAMLNILESDFHAAILRPDLVAFSTTQSPISGGATLFPTLEFYTERSGVPPFGTSSSNVRNISLVQYALIAGTSSDVPPRPTSTLQRSDMYVPWVNAATYLAFGNTSGFASTAPNATTGTPTARDTAPGVVAFEVVFVASNGSFSTTTFTPTLSISGTANTGTNGTPYPTRGIGVTIAVVDDQAMRLLTSSQVTTLQNGFASAITDAPPKQNIKAYWEHYLNNPANTTHLSWTSYPKNLGAGIGIYECYISIP